MTQQAPLRDLSWAHGTLTVQRLGGMLAPVTFVLKNGLQISPMHIAPWADEPDTAELPGILRRLRGEWPCIPFGNTAPVTGAPAAWAPLQKASEPGEHVHGFSSNHEWTWEPASDGGLALGLDYPVTSPVRRVERTVTPDPNGPAVDLMFRIHVRDACRLPLGLHPVFMLPAAPHTARLEPGRFDHGRTYPGVVEPSAPFFAIDQRFSDLSSVPLQNGGSVDASRLPFAEDVEDLLQLNGIDGSCALTNPSGGYRVRLAWQREHFPSLLLWFSNRGRKMPPWNGRHLAIGIEPVCSPFGLGPATATADNPVARSGTPTARQFNAGETFTTRYRISTEPL